MMILLMPASISLGATFTLALAAASPAIETVARDTARIYASNTIGAVAGALIAGFFLVPRFGLQATFVLTSRMLVVAGSVIAAIAATRPGKQRPTRLAGGVVLAGSVVAIVTFAAPEWDRDLISSGAYKYSRLIRAEDLEWSLRAGHLEYYKEGAAGTVSVRRLAGTRSLAIDGKVDASNGGDMLTQRLLGLLPIAAASGAARRTRDRPGQRRHGDAVLASGEVQRLDVVEISPEVVEASAYFERENRGVLNNPGREAAHRRWPLAPAPVRPPIRCHRLRAVQPLDGRRCRAVHTRVLRGRPRTTAIRRRVLPVGSHLRDRRGDLRSIVHTFASVFPDGTMWLVGESDLLLIGSVAGNIESRLAAVADRSRLGSVPALLNDVAVAPSAAPFVLLSLYAGGPNELAAFGRAPHCRPTTGCRSSSRPPELMYAPPEGNAVLRALAADAAVPAVVAEKMERAGAADWTARGHAALRARAFGMAHESFRRALALDSRSPDALRGSTDAAAGAQRLAEETNF